MSHIVQIQTEVRDVAAVHAACDRLGLPQPMQGSHRLFSGHETGLGVQLPGWLYPVVCNPETGQLKFDNYNGHWGEQAQLDRFLQRYAVEVSRLEARKRGYAVTEQPLTDGSIKLTVLVAG